MKRLPIVGEVVDAPVARPRESYRPRRPIVAFVGAIDPDDGLRVARAVVEALRGEGAPVGDVLVDLDTLGERERRGEPAVIDVAAGAAFVAACEPILAVFVTRGHEPASWTKEARSIRDRLDVAIAGDRGSLHGELARALVGAAERRMRQNPT